MFKHLDQVTLRTSKNVNYFSAIPGSETSPKGIWTVAATIGSDLLLTKNGCVIKVPITDVLKVSDTSLMTETVISELRNQLHGKK